MWLYSFWLVLERSSSGQSLQLGLQNDQFPSLQSICNICMSSYRQLTMRSMHPTKLRGIPVPWVPEELRPPAELSGNLSVVIFRHLCCRVHFADEILWNGLAVASIPRPTQNMLQVYRYPQTADGVAYPSHASSRRPCSMRFWSP